MAAISRILAISSDPALFTALSNEALHHQDWVVVDEVNPRMPGQLETAFSMVDIALIEAEEILWLMKNRPEVLAALSPVQTVVILCQRQLLEILTQPGQAYGLLFRRPSNRLPLNLLSVAIEGYVVSPSSLLNELGNNQQRLDTVSMLTPQELNVLFHLGIGLPNREIAEISGLAEGQVKTLVYSLTRKLHMRNRTAIAIFAATSGVTRGGDSGQEC